MFPKTASKKVMAWVAKLRDAIARAAACADATEKCRLLTQCDEIRSQIPSKAIGRRIDLLIRDEVSGDELWVDVTARHDNTKTLEQASLAHHGDIHLAGKFRIRSASEVLLISPASVAAEKEKLDTYLPLVHHAQLLVAKRLRRKAPRFVCGGVSHTGEFSVGVCAAIEWITVREAVRCRVEAATDGILPKTASGLLRTKLKDSLATTLWSGWGATLRLGGSANSKEREFAHY